MQPSAFQILFFWIFLSREAAEFVSPAQGLPQGWIAVCP
jgi:hypothetical protein